ncbi:MAG: hypothetical protein V2I37_05795 [Marinilabiliaceae bacterium]|jgi:hypothetical protein|nr:hypothetical protein [Marinilabiliaceae bacterium]
MDLQVKKQMIIERFRQIEDKNLIDAIQNLLDFAARKEKEKYSVPDTHQKLVMSRFEKSKKDPSLLMDWDEARETLKP